MAFQPLYLHGLGIAGCYTLRSFCDTPLTVLLPNLQCHGSRFAFDGKVLHAPAVKDLEPVNLEW